jgi:hypothetical protein
VIAPVKSVNQFTKGGSMRRRPVDQSDHGRVSSTVDYLVQAGLQGTELPAFRGGIMRKKCPTAVGDRAQCCSIIPGNHNHHIAVPA